MRKSDRRQGGSSRTKKDTSRPVCFIFFQTWVSVVYYLPCSTVQFNRERFESLYVGFCDRLWGLLVVDQQEEKKIDLNHNCRWNVVALDRKRKNVKRQDVLRIIHGFFLVVITLVWKFAKGTLSI